MSKQVIGSHVGRYTVSDLYWMDDDNFIISTEEQNDGSGNYHIEVLHDGLNDVTSYVAVCNETEVMWDADALLTQEEIDAFGEIITKSRLDISRMVKKSKVELMELCWRRDVDKINEILDDVSSKYLIALFYKCLRTNHEGKSRMNRIVELNWSGYTFPVSQKRIEDILQMRDDVDIIYIDHKLDGTAIEFPRRKYKIKKESYIVLDDSDNDVVDVEPLVI